MRTSNALAGAALVVVALEAHAQETPAHPAEQTADETEITSSSMEELPSARNLWVLLESQVPSVVTDRVDVGGLRGDVPAHFGGLGSSWTQNTYVLQGFDLSDPYMGDRPLFFPDFDSLERITVSKAVHPADISIPGIALRLVPMRGGDVFSGGAQLFAQGGATQADNLSEKQKAQGLTSPEHFRDFASGNFHAGGPIVPGRANYFFSFSATDFTRYPESVPDSVSSSLKTGLVNLTASLGPHDLSLLWTGYDASRPNAGTSSLVPLSASVREIESANALVLTDLVPLSQTLSLESHVGYVSASPRQLLQDGIREQAGMEMFTGVQTGAAPMETSGGRTRLEVAGILHGRTDFQSPMGLSLPIIMEYSGGLSWEEAALTRAWDVLDGVNLSFFNGQPYSVTLFDPAGRTDYHLRNVTAFIQTHSRFGGALAVDAGLQLRTTRGWLTTSAEPAISWTTLSPRLAVSLPVSRKTVFRAGFSRYYHRLLAQYLDFGNPDAPSSRTYLWNDLNGDRQFEQNELGALQNVSGGSSSRVDPGLKAPYTDEVMVGADFDLGPFDLHVTVMNRQERRLIATIDTGVPFSAYSPVTIHDNGNDNVPGTVDDQDLTVYAQDPATLGKNSYLLTNPEVFTSFYQGAEVVLALKGGPSKLRGSASLSAFRIVGKASPQPGSPEYDQGVIGNLYNDPNTLINAQGRLYFDRAFIAQGTLAYSLPWGFTAGTVAKYWDGIPFGRELIVTGLPQGPFSVLATSRANDKLATQRFRTEHSLTLDLGIEKTFIVSGGRLTARIDVFNLLNLGNATWENDLSGDNFQDRVPLETMAPRVLRAGLRYDF
ncbi:MAG: hypothetical protein ACM3JH_15825 [Acidithiobacillales bacterium]